MGQRKDSKKRDGHTIKEIFYIMLLKILAFIRKKIDQFIDWIFSLYYNEDKKKTVPSIKNKLILKSATSLAELIRQRVCTSEEIVKAFIDRCKEVNPFINAIVDERFEEAINDAKKIDQMIKDGLITDEDFKNKPFLGIPFTTKDSTQCKDMKFTLGLISRRNSRAEDDSDVVKLMKNAGGILIATTNVPEVNLWQETRNYVTGQTSNPYDTRRITGGSSGGEASLIASGGSPLGIGSDIGGSIRMPAYYCGIYGHKPTSDLTPLRGLTYRTGDEVNSMLVAGPMCKHSEDLAPFLKVLCGPHAKRLNLYESINLNDIKFFYVKSSRDMRTTPINDENINIMNRVVDFLDSRLKKNNDLKTPTEKQSAKVKEIYFNDLKYSSKLWRYGMSKENFDVEYELGNREKRLNGFVELVKKCFGLSDLTLAAVIVLIDKKLPKENSEWAEETLNRLRREIIDTLEDNGVLLYPSYTSSAPFHYVPFLRPYNFSYWSIFNALRLPVLQVPLGLDKNGLPIGIQIVTTPYNDKLALAVAKELEEEFNGWVPF